MAASEVDPALEIDETDVCLVCFGDRGGDRSGLDEIVARREGVPEEATLFLSVDGFFVDAPLVEDLGVSLGGCSDGDASGDASRRDRGFPEAAAGGGIWLGGNLEDENRHENALEALDDLGRRSGCVGGSPSVGCDGRADCSPRAGPLATGILVGECVGDFLTEGVSGITGTSGTPGIGERRDEADGESVPGPAEVVGLTGSSAEDIPDAKADCVGELLLWESDEGGWAFSFDSWEACLDERDRVKRLWKEKEEREVDGLAGGCAGGCPPVETDSSEDSGLTEGNGGTSSVSAESSGFLRSFDFSLLSIAGAIFTSLVYRFLTRDESRWTSQQGEAASYRKERIESFWTGSTVDSAR